MTVSTIRAVLDADVLYPLPLRDTLLSAAVEGCFQPLWSAAILDEAIRNLVKAQRMTPDGAIALRRNLDAHFEDARVTGYEALVGRMHNHPKDRHVAACAVAGKADLIVTSNIKDFARLPHGILAVTPDDFLSRLLTDTPNLLRKALQAQSARLKRKPMSVAEIVTLLEKVAPKFAATWQAGA
ncbi:PIN domain-containing protein [Oleomonas cavernae]|uniref:PIN domain-containing protein n=1 Tax=Oleomonas cavernae TaxID=2320859 RepID=A0A418WDS4_9PROT|nr:PIN domain-containing protein [Oleomonas cavernae]RJF88171.1 PIN domain-containing protein [Oleomonas cavernae]